jgi:hypothetical protein
MDADIAELADAGQDVESFIRDDPRCHGPAADSPLGVRWRNAVDAIARDLGLAPPLSALVDMSGIFCIGPPGGALQRAAMRLNHESA